MFVSSGILQIPGEECTVRSRNIIIYMFDDNRTGIIFCYKHVAIFAPDTAYIFGVLKMLSVLQYLKLQ